MPHFHELPLFGKILVVTLFAALYVAFIIYAAKFCAFNDTPPSPRKKGREVPVRRRTEGAPLPASQADS